MLGDSSLVAWLASLLLLVELFLTLFLLLFICCSTISASIPGWAVVVDIILFYLGMLPGVQLSLRFGHCSHDHRFWHQFIHSCVSRFFFFFFLLAIDLVLSSLFLLAILFTDAWWLLPRRNFNLKIKKDKGENFDQH